MLNHHSVKPKCQFKRQLVFTWISAKGLRSKHLLFVVSLLGGAPPAAARAPLGLLAGATLARPALGGTPALGGPPLGGAPLGGTPASSPTLRGHGALKVSSN